MRFDEKLFNGEVFGKYVERIPNTKRNELIKCGALRQRPELKTMFSEQTGSLYATIPMFGLLDGETLNYDGSTVITATSTTTFSQSMIAYGRAKAWTERDFSTDITGGVDFMDNVAQQVANYWDEQDQQTLLSVLKGIFAMTGAKNLEFVNNHTLDISAADGDAAKVAATTLNTAIQQAAGDNKKAFTMVLMHSVVATNLENLNLVERLKYTDANGIQRELSLGTWNGRTVIIDDGMPVEHVEASGSGDTMVPAYDKYTTYVLGAGAIDYCDIGAEVPYEMQRDPAKSGGQTTLYSRQRKLYAPYGISFTKASVASLSPTNAEFELGANWTLVNDGGTGSARKYIDHKAIPIARIISRG